MCPSGSKPQAVLQAITIGPVFGNLVACWVDGKAIKLLWVNLCPRDGLRLVGTVQESLFCWTVVALNEQGGEEVNSREEALA